MDSNQKSWAWGCGCGCLTALPTFIVVYGLCVLFAYLMWEVGDVRSDFFEGPAALAWGGFVGLLAGGLLGVIAIFAARAIVKKRLAKKEAEEGAMEQPPQQVPPQQPPQQPPPQQPPPQYPPPGQPPPQY